MTPPGRWIHEYCNFKNMIAGQNWKRKVFCHPPPGRWCQTRWLRGRSGKILLYAVHIQIEAAVHSLEVYIIPLSCFLIQPKAAAVVPARILIMSYFQFTSKPNSLNSSEPLVDRGTNLIFCTHQPTLCFTKRWWLFSTQRLCTLPSALMPSIR